MGDQFTDIQLTINTLDRYFIRSSIFKALQSSLPSFTGHLLDVGCGKMPYRDFILKNSDVENYTGLDIETALVYEESVTPDFYWDGIKMPFEDESYHCAMATEVLEHCPEPEIVLKEIHRVLKPSGILFFTVPFLWNLHEVPHDEYRYTPFSLERHLKNSGFTTVTINASGGWHASMAQMLGLWVRRAPMSNSKRKYLSHLLKPVIKKLIAKDRGVKTFKNRQMITGLWGVAIK